jgi:hypothetical protein
MKDFIPYQQALALKELGFNEPCFKVYDTMGYVQDEQTMLNMRLDYCSAPLYQQAFRWFREKQYYSEITTECTQADGSIGFSWRIWKPWLIEEWSPENGNDEWSYKTYEEAELECLIKLIEIVKTK